MKVLSIIYSLLLTIFIIGMTIWQVSFESSTFVICMFFIMCFMAIYILCKSFDEFYKEKKYTHFKNK